MGYYDGKDIPYYWNLADNFVLFRPLLQLGNRRQRRKPHVLGRGICPADPHDAPKGGSRGRRSSTASRRLESRGSVSNATTRRSPTGAHTTGDRDSRTV